MSIINLLRRYYDVLLWMYRPCGRFCIPVGVLSIKDFVHISIQFQCDLHMHLA